MTTNTPTITELSLIGVSRLLEEYFVESLKMEFKRNSVLEALDPTQRKNPNMSKNRLITIPLGPRELANKSDMLPQSLPKPKELKTQLIPGSLTGGDTLSKPFYPKAIATWYVRDG
jgi:hypothetical protein